MRDEDIHRGTCKVPHNHMRGPCGRHRGSLSHAQPLFAPRQASVRTVRSQPESHIPGIQVLTDTSSRHWPATPVRGGREGRDDHRSSSQAARSVDPDQLDWCPPATKP